MQVQTLPITSATLLNFVNCTKTAKTETDNLEQTHIDISTSDSNQNKQNSPLIVNPIRQNPDEPLLFDTNSSLNLNFLKEYTENITIYSPLPKYLKFSSRNYKKPILIMSLEYIYFVIIII